MYSKKNIDTIRIKMKILIVLGVVLTALIAAFILLVSLSEFTLKIVEPNIKAEYASEFEDPGVQIIFADKCIKKKVFSSNKIDTEVLGEQKLTYEARFLWKKATAQRTVIVEDTREPVITLNYTGKLTLPNHEYEEEGYIAYDNYDGEITHLVKREIKGNLILYSVEDSSGNVAKKVRIICYGDETPPKINLRGSSKTTIYVGDNYTEPGFSAVDDLDGDITANVKVSGDVDNKKLGKYTITYSVSDKHGNKA